MVGNIEEPVISQIVLNTNRNKTIANNDINAFLLYHLQPKINY